MNTALSMGSQWTIKDFMKAMPIMCDSVRQSVGLRLLNATA